MKIKEYDLAKIISDVYNYQQNELCTYKIIVTIETLVIILLAIELAGRLNGIGGGQIVTIL